MVKMIDDPKSSAGSMLDQPLKKTIPKIPPDKISPKNYMKARNNCVYSCTYFN